MVALSPSREYACVEIYNRARGVERNCRAGTSFEGPRRYNGTKTSLRPATAKTLIIFRLPITKVHKPASLITRNHRSTTSPFFLSRCAPPICEFSIANSSTRAVIKNTFTANSLPCFRSIRIFHFARACRVHVCVDSNDPE